MMITTSRTGTLLSVALLAAAGCAADASEPQALGASAAALTSGAPDLIAIGSLSGSLSDLSNQTAGSLENGVAGNLLGGIGSGFAYAGGKRFVAVPDRGPNAVSYDSAIDDTVSYINRFQTLKMRLTPNESSAALPYALTPTLKKTTLLWDKDALVYGSGQGLGVGDGAPALNKKNKHYFTGRSDNFDPTQPSSDWKDARLDPESIRVSSDGRDVFISDEYGPYVYRFDRATGRRTQAFSLPPEFAVAQPSAQGSVEKAESSGRVANKGMEGLALVPSGQTLVGIMQSPLLQDGGRFTRIVSISVSSGAVQQFAYELTNIGTSSKPKYTTVSDIVAVNEHQFLVDERDGNGLGDDSVASYKKLWLIDLSGAQDVTGISAEANLAGKAVGKTLFADLVAIFNAHGIASEDIPSKLEGVSFGPDVTLGGSAVHTLFVANDNDFTATVTDSHHPNGIDNPNQFFVLGFDSSALPGYTAPAVADAEDDGGDDLTQQ